MTTLEHNPNADFVAERIDETKRRIKLLGAVAALLSLLAYTIAFLSVIILADHIADGGLAQGTRRIARWVYLTGAAILFVRLIVLPSVRHISDLFAAKQIENRHPEFHNSLISALQLSRRDSLPGSLRSALAARAAGDLLVTDLWRALDKRAARQAGLVAVATAGAFLLYAAFAPKPVWPSVWRALGVELPPPTRTQIAMEQPDPNAEVLVGDPVRFVARISGREPETAHVRFSLDGGQSWLPDHRLALSPPPTVQTVDPRERERWRAVKSGRDVQESMHYQFFAGDATSALRLLRVRPYPEIAGVTLRTEPLPYTGAEPVEHEGGNVDAAVGTRVVLAIRTSVPAETPPLLDFRKSNKRLRTTPQGPANTEFEGGFRVEEDDTYTIRYRDRAGIRNRDPVVYTVRARPDTPPRVEVVQPDDGVHLPAGGVMSLACSAHDDFGLSDVRLDYEVGPSVGAIPLFEMPQENTQEVSIARQIEVATFGAEVGERVTWWITAKDNRHTPGGAAVPQIARSERRHFVVEPPKQSDASAEEAPPAEAPSPTTGPEEQEGPSDASSGESAVASPDATGPSEVNGSATTRPAGERQARPSSMPTATRPTSSPARDEIEQWLEANRDKLEVLKKHLEKAKAQEPAEEAPDVAEQERPARKADRTKKKPTDLGDRPRRKAPFANRPTKTQSDSDRADGRDVDREDGTPVRSDQGEKAVETPDGREVLSTQAARKYATTRATSTRPTAVREGPADAANKVAKSRPTSGESGQAKGGDQERPATSRPGGKRPDQSRPGQEQTARSGQADKPKQGDQPRQEPPSGDAAEQGRKEAEQAEQQAESSSRPQSEQGEAGSAAAPDQKRQDAGEREAEQPVEASDPTCESCRGAGCKECNGTGKKPASAASQSEKKGQAASSSEGECKGEEPGGGKGSSTSAQQSTQAQGEGKGQGQQRGESSGEGKGKGEGESKRKGKGKASAERSGGGASTDPRHDKAPTPDPTSRPAQLDGQVTPLDGGPSGSKQRDATVRAQEVLAEFEKRFHRGEIDPNLLEELDWTPEQASRFVQEFRQLKEQPPPRRVRSRDRARRIIETDVLQPGELRWQQGKDRGGNVRGGSAIDRRDPDEVQRLLEVRRQQVSEEYRALLEAYYRSVASPSPKRSSSQPALPSP